MGWSAAQAVIIISQPCYSSNNRTTYCAMPIPDKKERRKATYQTARRTQGGPASIIIQDGKLSTCAPPRLVPSVHPVGLHDRGRSRKSRLRDFVRDRRICIARNGKGRDGTLLPEPASPRRWTGFGLAAANPRGAAPAEDGRKTCWFQRRLGKRW
jgi:hypothetical protein